MSLQRFLGDFREALVREQELLAQYVLTGQCITFEDYREKVGRHAAVADMLALSDKIEKDITAS